MTYAYQGIVVSGADIGVWRYKRRPPTSARATTTLATAIHTVNVPLREYPPAATLRERMEITTDRATWEKTQRQLMIREAIGEADARSLPLWCWRLGDALLLAVPDEPYNILQRQVRAAFPDRPVLVLTVTNGTFGYLCPTETYGSGRYQVVQSPYLPGCLEKVADAAITGPCTQCERKRRKRPRGRSGSRPGKPGDERRGGIKQSVRDDKVRKPELLPPRSHVRRDLVYRADKHGGHRQYVRGGDAVPPGVACITRRCRFPVVGENERDDGAQFNGGKSVARRSPNPADLFRHLRGHPLGCGTDERARRHGRGEDADNVRLPCSEREHPLRAATDEQGEAALHGRRKLVRSVTV